MRSTLREPERTSDTIPRQRDDKFASQRPVYFIEFCAGSAALSAEVRRAGFKVIPIDHVHNRHRTLATIVSLDLAADASRDLVLSMLTDLQPFAVHFGLPCGTCSRARDKALPKHLRDRFGAPPPLRDAEFLMGFPHLTGVNLQKVTQANRLYANAVIFLHACFRLGIRVCIENPQRSWLWGILLALVREQNDPAFLHCFAHLVKVDFHSCIHGSQRAKKTRFLASKGLYDSLAGECPGDHEHLPWTIEQTGSGLRFATADEAQYPQLLCSRMAQCLTASATTLGHNVVQQPSTSQQTRHSLGNQTVKAKPLICEFERFVHSDVPLTTEGHKLLASPLPGGSNAEMPQNKRLRMTFKYGVQWKPEDFLEHAKQVSHPRSPQQMLPDYLKEAMFHVLSNSAVEASKHRLQVILAIRSKCNELKAEETAWKNSLDTRQLFLLIGSPRSTPWKIFSRQRNGADEL